ncbi:MAG: choice-of-anchor D domain-containing protein [Akkermansiaceae bacterium]|nr:choice-of-anchor D domain-containing protein [Akkermansiaceae bacterium]
MWAKKIVGNAAGFGYHVASLPNSDFVYGGYTAAADFGFGTISTGPLNREAYLVRVTGFPSPEIGVEAGGVELASGGPPLDAGSAVIGGTAAALTLTLRNDGGEELTGIAVTPGGAQPGDFILDTSATATTLAPGGTTTFSVQFAPTAAGARAATISIASNDYDENPFVIALGGTGLLPEVALAVSPDTVAEDSGGGLVFTFTRNGGTGSPLAVDFAVGGTAGFPGDYTADGADSFSASSGTLTIPAGSASAALTLVPVADPVLEVDETATLTVLAGASYLAGSPAAATGTLINDDTEVSVTVSPATLAEDATGSFAFTLTRNGPLAAPLSVNLGVGGSAAFPADYNVTGADSFSASTASVTFAPGSTTAVLEITPQADTTVEPDESVILTVVSGSGYLAAAPVSATATLVNDDTDVSVTVSPASVPEDGAANLVFTFTRVGVTSGALSANFSVGGSATFGTDYSVSGAASFSASAGSVNFAQDAATASVTVDPVADSTSEPNESVQLTVLAGGGYNAASPVSATGFINDDDSNISVTVSPASIKEDGAQNLVFTFTRTGLTANAVTVNFTVGGTANFPGDYSVSGAASFAAGSGTVAMAAGASTATVTVDPALDLLTEPDETVTLTVAAGSGYTVGSPVSATGTIENDDTLVQVGVAPTAVAEDGEQNLVYTFTRSGVTNVPLTVGFGVGGTASSGSDYTASGTASFGTSTGTVFFPADVTTKEVTVDPTADTLIEPDETVILTLTSGSNYRTAGPPATGTILTDDTEVTVFLNPATIVESGPVNFTVGGTATFGSDYTVANAASFSATSGSVTFPAGMAFRAVNVFPIADTVVEPDETVILTIVAGTGYQPGLTFSYTGTILNDDIEQEIAVEQPSGSGLTSGAATSDFGALVNGSSKTRVFTIRNLGTVPLTGISVDKSGPQAARFAITQPAASIPGGGSSTFAVTFTPTESGPCSASLAIASNDANENPFTIALQGSGGSAQQLLDAALAAAGLSGPNAHPGATPFHDGVPNLLKYAFHMNLTGPDRRTLVPTTGTVGLPVMRIVSGSVRYEFLRRKNRGLIYTPQQSSNLSGSGWQAASGTTTVTSIDENWERVEIQQPVGVARFFRVVVGL